MQKNQNGFASARIPLYYQLENVLREKITSGAFASGDRLPTESELIKQYGVSRITVRQALSTLAEEGLIERQQGRGTFVAQRRTRRRKLNGITHLTGSLDELLEMGTDIRVKVLEFNLVEADKNEAEIFQVKVGTPVYRLKRLRLVDDKPYSLIVNYLPADFGSQLTQEELSSGAILQMIETKFGVRLSEAKQQIKAELADPYAAGQLGVRVGSPLLSIERTVFDDGGKPVEFGHTLYRSDLHGFSVHLKRENKKSKKTKAAG
jgi:GntR family transcriptional regulator